MTLKQLKKAVNKFDPKLDNTEIIMTSWMEYGFGELILCTNPSLIIKRVGEKVCLIMSGEEDKDERG